MPTRWVPSEAVAIFQDPPEPLGLARSDHASRCKYIAFYFENGGNEAEESGPKTACLGTLDSHIISIA